MKKKNLNKLMLKKTAISKLDNLRGGNLAHAAGASPIAAATNMISNCDVCNTARNTQCKDECPNFTKAACKKAAAPINAAGAANNAAAAV